MWSVSDLVLIAGSKKIRGSGKEPRCLHEWIKAFLMHMLELVRELNFPHRFSYTECSGRNWKVFQGENGLNSDFPLSKTSKRIGHVRSHMLMVNPHTHTHYINRLFFGQTYNISQPAMPKGVLGNLKGQVYFTFCS